MTIDIALLCCAALMALAGCGAACRTSRLSSASLASAPESLQIDGREYAAYAHAWRDFQPVAPPDGQPLVVVVNVLSSDFVPLPADLAVDQVWVLHGKEQWSAAPESGGSLAQSAVRGGPKWGPGIKVDVVARLRQGKNTWLVRAAGVEIKRTD